jgi:hypothetical protein
LRRKWAGYTMSYMVTYIMSLAAMVQSRINGFGTRKLLLYIYRSNATADMMCMARFVPCKRKEDGFGVLVLGRHHYQYAFHKDPQAHSMPPLWKHQAGQPYSPPHAPSTMLV